MASPLKHFAPTRSSFGKAWPVHLSQIPHTQGMTWKSQISPDLGLIYEFGFHIAYEKVPDEKYYLDRRWRKHRKRYCPPLTKVTNLQALCIRYIHKRQGPRQVQHYHLKHQDTAPYFFTHLYTYDFFIG